MPLRANGRSAKRRCLYKFPTSGKHWKCSGQKPEDRTCREERRTMVKGTSRRVIVVDSPDPKLFEQAIFIVKNDAFTQEGITSQQILGEACRIARGCAPEPAEKPSLWRRMPWWCWMLLGAASAAGAALLLLL